MLKIPRVTAKPSVTLPSDEEMLARLTGVSDDPVLVREYYPRVIAHVRDLEERVPGGTRERFALGVYHTLFLPIEYLEKKNGSHAGSKARQYFARFIDSLADDAEVGAEAKEIYARIQSKSCFD